MGQPVIAVDDVSKQFRIYHGGASTLKEIIVNFRRRSYEEFWALRDVSVEIEHGQTVGLIGPNGSGKTTLLKCIAGILQPTSGQIQVAGRVASLLELGAGFHPELTGRENVYMNASILGLSKKEVASVFDDIVAFSELERFIDNQVKFYSSGMYVRLGFAVAINVDPSILLVDEVLAVGDEKFQQKCLDKVRQFQREGRTIVFVSHGLEQVRQLCNRAMFLRDGELRFVGSAADAVRAFRTEVYGEVEHGEEDETAGSTVGTGEVRIGRVLINGRATTMARIEAGDPLRIEVTCEPVKASRPMIVGVALHDEWDRDVFGTNTMTQGLDIGVIDRPTKVTFDFPTVPLQDGRYRITVGATSESADVYDWHDRAYGLEVVNTTTTIGPVHFDGTITVQGIEAESPPVASQI